MNEQEYFDMCERQATRQFLLLVSKELIDKSISLVDGTDEEILTRKNNKELVIKYQWHDDLTDEENFESIAKEIDQTWKMH